MRRWERRVLAMRPDEVPVGGYRGLMAPEIRRRWTAEEFFRGAAAPTDDDVPIAADGRLLDSPEKVIAYLNEINARRAASLSSG